MTNNWLTWLNETRYIGLTEENIKYSLLWLAEIKKLILINSQIKKTDTVLDIGCGKGELGLEVLKAQNGMGKVFFLDIDKNCIAFCKEEVKKLKINNCCKFISSSLESAEIEYNSIDKIIMRSVLSHIHDKKNALNKIYNFLKPDGRLTAFEPVLSLNTKYYQFLDSKTFPNYEKYKKIEEKIYNDKNEALFNYDINTLEKHLKKAGFKNIELIKYNTKMNTKFSVDIIFRWFNYSLAPDKKTFKDRFLEYLSIDEFNEYINLLEKHLSGKYFDVEPVFVLIKATK